MTADRSCIQTFLIAAQRPSQPRHYVSDAFGNRLNKLSRNNAAGDLVFEDKAFARCGLDLELDVAKLAAAARLLLEYFFAGCGGRDGFAVRNLRFTDVCLDAEF